MSSLASLYGPNVKCVRRIRKEGRGDVCGVRGPNNPSGGRLRPLLQVLVPDHEVRHLVGISAGMGDRGRLDDRDSGVRLCPRSALIAASERGTWMERGVLEANPNCSVSIPRDVESLEDTTSEISSHHHHHQSVFVLTMQNFLVRIYARDRESTAFPRSLITRHARPIHVDSIQVVDSATTTTTVRTSSVTPADLAIQSIPELARRVHVVTGTSTMTLSESDNSAEPRIDGSDFFVDSDALSSLAPIALDGGGLHTYKNAGADTDLVLLSSDDVEFHVHSLILKMSSPVFGDMLRTPRSQATSTESAAEAVVLAEPAAVLSLLLDIVYPGRGQLQNVDFGGHLLLLKATGLAAIKYDMWAALEAIKAFLVSPRLSQNTLRSGCTGLHGTCTSLARR